MSSLMPERDAAGEAATGTGALVDVVDSWEEARKRGLSPLVVLAGLQRVLGLDEPPAVTRIDAGHSNPTFLVEASGRRMVLRRPPRPPYARGAHDVLREHRVLTALRDRAVRTPVPVLACEDPAVTGAPFYLMEALDGIVLRDVTPPPLDTPQERARCGAELVDALAELHAVDPHGVGLGSPAKGEGYLERQLRLWTEQWGRNQTRPVPALDEVAGLLAREQPSSPRAAVVHGDYKLDNVMYAASAPAHLEAILDWEMATLGDPLADLGWLTATWIDRGEAPDRLAGISAVTTEPGFPTRHELAERYATASGRSLDELAWYQALALWKLAILLEASYRRFKAGTTADPFFATLEQGVPRIAEQALGASRGALL